MGAEAAVVEIETEEHDNRIQLPAEIAVNKIQFLFNQEEIDQFCVEIVSENNEKDNLKVSWVSKVPKVLRGNFHG